VSLPRAGFWLGLTLATAMLLTGPPDGLAEPAWRTAAVMALMACWWFTEAVPVTLTGSLPFLLLPLLGVAKADQVAGQYMSPVLFLVLGGALIGLAFEKWNLHRRVALFVVSRSSPEPRHLLLAVMAVTAALSLFVNNSATTVMMLPIATAALAAVVGVPGAVGQSQDQRRFAAAMVLSVTYASNIGGFGTPIGTPVNPVMLGVLERSLGVQISFVEWMAFGLPFVVVAIPLCWWMLCRVTLPFRLPAADRQTLMAALGELPPMGSPERRVIAVVVLTSAAWILQPLYQSWVPGLSDAGIAVAGALLLCVMPSGRPTQSGTPGGRLLEWQDARAAPWYLILLLGGGLALADSVVKSGLSAWMGAALGDVAGLPLLPLLLVVAVMCALVTEAASNIATATIFMPIAIALATAGGHDPVVAAIAAGLAASLGFANPAGTSSNAIVFSTGRVRIADMFRSGLLFDLIGAVLVALVCATIVPALGFR
jgi:sodium-dependent dicarboxylate transporter 2/3/5